MPEFRRRIDVMLEPSYLGGISERSIDDVRAMHDQLLEVETEVSYVRRLAQARIDIVEAELARRASGSGGTIADLVNQLPTILADETPRGDATKSRLPRHLAPSMDIVWRRGLEHLISDSTLVNLPTTEDDELRTTLDLLRELERETSNRRRALHKVIDAVEADLAARHKADLA